MAKRNGRNWVFKLIWLAFYAIVGFTLYSAIQFKANQTVREVVVNIISKENQRSLIGEKDILRYINRSLDKDLEIQKIEGLEVKRIEEILNASSFIESAEVFVNTKGVVYIECKVRAPIVRFDRGEEKGFYLDEEGIIIPLSKRASVRVPVASGALGTFSKDFMLDEANPYRQVYEMARRINEDKFLSALIEQIHVENSGKIILVPKLGRQKILFGDFAQLDERFEKLKAFYKTGMPNSGWDRFEYLNLQWNDQVVGVMAN